MTGDDRADERRLFRELDGYLTDTEHPAYQFDVEAGLARLKTATAQSAEKAESAKVAMPLDAVESPSKSPDAEKITDETALYVASIAGGFTDPISEKTWQELVRYAGATLRAWIHDRTIDYELLKLGDELYGSALSRIEWSYILHNPDSCDQLIDQAIAFAVVVSRRSPNLAHDVKLPTQFVFICLLNFRLQLLDSVQQLDTKSRHIIAEQPKRQNLDQDVLQGFLDELADRDRHLVLQKASGWPAAAIAKSLGVSRQYVRRRWTYLRGRYDWIRDIKLIDVRSRR